MKGWINGEILARGRVVTTPSYSHTTIWVSLTSWTLSTIYHLSRSLAHLIQLTGLQSKHENTLCHVTPTPSECLTFTRLQEEEKCVTMELRVQSTGVQVSELSGVHHEETHLDSQARGCYMLMLCII